MSELVSDNGIVTFCLKKKKEIKIIFHSILKLYNMNRRSCSFSIEFLCTYFPPNCFILLFYKSEYRISKFREKSLHLNQGTFNLKVWILKWDNNKYFINKHSKFSFYEIIMKNIHQRNTLVFFSKNVLLM